MQQLCLQRFNARNSVCDVSLTCHFPLGPCSFELRHLLCFRLNGVSSPCQQLPVPPCLECCHLARARLISRCTTLYKSIKKVLFHAQHSSYRYPTQAACEVTQCIEVLLQHFPSYNTHVAPGNSRFKPHRGSSHDYAAHTCSFCSSGPGVHQFHLRFHRPHNGATAAHLRPPMHAWRSHSQFRSMR